MKGNVATLGLAAALWLLIPQVTFGQEASGSIEPGTIGVGVQVGGNQVFGDFQNNTLAPGFEATVSYYLLPNFMLNIGVGYSRTKGGPDAPPRNFTYTNNLLTLDFLGQYRLLQSQPISPYVRFGIAEYNFGSGGGRFFDTALIGGGGVEFWARSDLAVFLGADYYQTITSPGDGLDGVVAAGRDGLLRGRIGVQFLIRSPATLPPEILATEPAPVIQANQKEGEQLEGFVKKMQTMENKDQADDMQQYLKLRSRIDELQQRIEDREQKINKLMSSVEEKKREIESLESQVERQPARESGAPTPSQGTAMSKPSLKISPEFSKAYEEALNNYYMKRYDKAIEIFQHLLQTYPNHSLASNSEYWMAESYFGAGRLEEAEKHFWRVLDYPRSLKKDDALFSLSKLYLARNDSTRARQVLQRLVTDFPNSEYAPKAEQQLARL